MGITIGSAYPTIKTIKQPIIVEKIVEKPVIAEKPIEVEKPKRGRKKKE